MAISGACVRTWIQTPLMIERRARTVANTMGAMGKASLRIRYPITPNTSVIQTSNMKEGIF